MKNTLFSTVGGLLLVANAYAVTVDEPTDSFTTGIGDFSEISGFEAASSPGQVLEILGGSGSTSADFAAGVTLNMGDLWDILDAGMVGSASILGFGFGINETGPTGSNSVDVTAITLSFELPDTTVQTYDLNMDPTVSVFNYNQGTNTAEAIFFVDLGFDFMSTYNTNSTEDFSAFMTLENTDDGFEILFLGSAFAGGPPPPNPMPEPGTLLVLTAGLFGIWGATRRRRS